MIAAVVFDLDGVLVDSEPIWERVRRQFVTEHGGRWLPDAQQRLMGMSTAEWAAYLSGDLGVRLSPQEVAVEVIERMRASYRDHVPLIAGAAECVQRLAARWPLAVASSSPPSLIDVVLDSAGLRASFLAALSTEQVARGKPAPDIYLAAAARLAVEPERCVAVEDSTNGLLSAAAAGLVVVAVPQPGYPPAPAALAGSRLVIANLDELTPERLAALGH